MQLLLEVNFRRGPGDRVWTSIVPGQGDSGAVASSALRLHSHGSAPADLAYSPHGGAPAVHRALPMAPTTWMLPDLQSLPAPGGSGEGRKPPPEEVAWVTATLPARLKGQDPQKPRGQPWLLLACSQAEATHFPGVTVPEVFPQICLQH